MVQTASLHCCLVVGDRTVKLVRLSSILEFIILAHHLELCPVHSHYSERLVPFYIAVMWTTSSFDMLCYIVWLYLTHKITKVMYLPSTYELSLIHKIYSSLYVNIEKQLHDMQISVYKREVHFNKLLLKYEVLILLT